MAVWIGAVVAPPAGGAAGHGTGLWHAPAMRDRGVQNDVHRLLDHSRQTDRQTDRQVAIDRIICPNVISDYLRNHGAGDLVHGRPLDAQQQLVVQIPDSKQDAIRDRGTALEQVRSGQVVTSTNSRPSPAATPECRDGAPRSASHSNLNHFKHSHENTAEKIMETMIGRQI